VLLDPWERYKNENAIVIIYFYPKITKLVDKTNTERNIYAHLSGPSVKRPIRLFIIPHSVHIVQSICSVFLTSAAHIDVVELIEHILRQRSVGLLSRLFVSVDELNMSI
jgi:hypothetical protein